MHTLYYLQPKKVHKDNGKLPKNLSRFNLYFAQVIVMQWSNGEKSLEAERQRGDYCSGPESRWWDSGVTMENENRRVHKKSS